MWEKIITIYHKVGDKFERYNVQASVRFTTMHNRSDMGVSNSQNALIRIFDVEGYKYTWNISKGDIIVNKEVTDEVIKAPLTELKKIYGEDSVFQVKSIDELIFDDQDLPNHIKIGAN